MANWDLANLGREQKIALQKFHRPELREGLVRYLNRALQPAARSLLNLQDSSQLEELFARVRREFGRRGTELVLLIEDLVSMSSIADPLLELAKRRPKRRPKRSVDMGTDQRIVAELFMISFMEDSSPRLHDRADWRTAAMCCAAWPVCLRGA